MLLWGARTSDDFALAGVLRIASECPRKSQRKWLTAWRSGSAIDRVPFAKPVSTLSDLERRRASARVSARGV
jgi:hypothetical protein